MNRVQTSLLLTALFLSLAPTAQASSTWYVNGVSGSDSNSCSSPTSACKTIRHAISLASSGDYIMVAAATYKENPENLTIGISLNIVGAGPTTTIIDAGGQNTVVTVSNTGASVMLSNLTIRNGFSSSGGGVHNSGTLMINNVSISNNRASLFGGGISNVGSLRIINSTVSSNAVGGICWDFCAAWGGGIYNYAGGTVTISNSTVSDNLANLSCLRGGCSARGGGIVNGGRLTITNSTLSGNTAHYLFNGMSTGSGGGIYNGATVTINNSTLSGNSAFGSGGGITNGGTVLISNTIVANSPSGGNCSGTVTSSGYNLSSDGTCNFNSGGDLNNHDPLLGPLQKNGGPTDTMALLPGSLAIDAGNPGGCIDGQGHLLTTDQRGMPRPDKEDQAGCDIGAFESQSD